MKREDIEQIVSEEQARGLGNVAANTNAPVYEVVAGNIGFVYDGQDRREAEETFWRYAGASKNRRGRVAGEQVTLFEDGEPIREWAGDYGE